MLVVTMYNEDHILLGRTLKGIMDNVKYMVKKKIQALGGRMHGKRLSFVSFQMVDPKLMNAR